MVLLTGVAREHDQKLKEEKVHSSGFVNDYISLFFTKILSFNNSSKILMYTILILLQQNTPEYGTITKGGGQKNNKKKKSQYKTRVPQSRIGARLST